MRPLTAASLSKLFFRCSTTDKLKVNVTEVTPTSVELTWKILDPQHEYMLTSTLKAIGIKTMYSLPAVKDEE